MPVMEMVGPRFRGHLGMLYWVFYSIGVLVSSIWAYFLRSYRYLAMINLLGLSICAFIW